MEKRVAIDCPAQVPETTESTFCEIWSYFSVCVRVCVCFVCLLLFIGIVVLYICLCLHRFFCCCWAQSEIHPIICMAFVEQNMWFHSGFSSSLIKIYWLICCFLFQFEKSLHILHLFRLVYCSVWLGLAWHASIYANLYFTILLLCVAFVVRSIKNTNRYKVYKHFYVEAEVAISNFASW